MRRMPQENLGVRARPSLAARAAAAARTMIGWLHIARANDDYELVAESGLFDAVEYVRERGGLGVARDPLRHFLHRGWREGRDPSSAFSTDWYLDQYPDVRKARINPLVHYLRCGRDEGRLPRRPGSTSVAKLPLGPYEAWLAVNELSDRDIADIRQRLDQCAGPLPTISVITPVYNPEATLLEKTIKSVQEQLYDKWELCLIDDGSSAPHVGPLLEHFAASDVRIKIKKLRENGGISAATNAAVEMAKGDVIVFLDHDDLFSRDCLAELALYYGANLDADVVYSDDDKIDREDRRYAPQFKPDWSPALLLSWMYISHAFSVRRQLFDRIGGFRSKFDGSQDHDFALRATEAARHVGHVPKILYHWRAVEGSTATDGQAKPRSIPRGLNAVQEALERRGAGQAVAVQPEWAVRRNAGYFDIQFPNEGPSVTIVIHSNGGSPALRKTLESLSKTAYCNYQVLALGRDGQDAELLRLVDEFNKSHGALVSTSQTRNDSNAAASKNDAARHCTSDYLLFLDEGIEVVSASWLSQMVGYAKLLGSGAVGASILSDDETILHAGLVRGLDEGLVGPAFRGLRGDDVGYLALARTSRECSAVSGACLLTPRALFEELGGFDQVRFPFSYHDVDYCYRLLGLGKSCVYVASAEVRVCRRGNFSGDHNPEERANFRRLFGNGSDPWYNQNLSLDNERFEIDAVRGETASAKPVRLLVASQNLNQEGAPTTLLDLLLGLVEKGAINPIIVSSLDGPLREQYEKHGIKVIILDHLMQGVFNRETQTAALHGVGMLFKALDAEVVLANTLQTYWAVKGATMARLPSVWAQHESEPWETYFDYLPSSMRAAAYEAFAEAYRVTFVAEATRRAWRTVETRRNFKIIRHAIPPRRLEQETTRWTRATAREELGIAEEAFVLSVVGTVCRRKGQLDLVKAFARLAPKVRSNTFVYVVGAIGEQDYADELKASGTDNRIVITDRVEDPFLYHRATDVSICTSSFESAPRVVMEAMACGLPIVTTPVFGIPEIVRENVNALFYEPGDVRSLASAIEELWRNVRLREELASNSPIVAAGQPGFSNMVEQYGRIIRQAVNLRL